MANMVVMMVPVRARVSGIRPRPGNTRGDAAVGELSGQHLQLALDLGECPVGCRSHDELVETDSRKRRSSTWLRYGQVAPVSQASMPPVFEVPPNAGGATPMTENGWLLSAIDLPRAPCADPNADCASPWLMTTTGEPNGPRSSSGVKLLPALIRTPRTSKKSAVTTAVPVWRGRPPGTERLALLS